MTRLYIFADEAGDFTFRRADNISRYFILCTVSMEACAVGYALLNLRRKLIWLEQPLGEYFHATSDKQAVRDLVFETICRHSFQVQATIMEKSKAEPQVHRSKPRLYHYGWYYHFKYVMRPIARPFSEVHVTAASLGDKKEKPSFRYAVRDVLQQTMDQKKWRMDIYPAANDPCLQVADYCAWAIQRKWERGDTKSYDIIAKNRRISEFDPFEPGNKHYY